MKLTAAYQNVTIESGVTLTDFKKATRISKKAPYVFENSVDNPIFGITFGERGAVSDEGICFNKTTDKGNMYVTITDEKMPKDAVKRRAYLNDKFGIMLTMLTGVEDGIKDCLEAFQGAFTQNINSNIILAGEPTDPEETEAEVAADAE